MKRKKLIAALTAAAMVVTMLPSVAMAKGTSLEDGNNSQIVLVGEKNQSISYAEATRTEYVNKNVQVKTESVRDGETIAYFTTTPGKKLPYLEKFTGFTEYEKEYAKYYPANKAAIEELELAYGNYVDFYIALPETYDGGAILAQDHPVQNTTTDKVTFGQFDFTGYVHKNNVTRTELTPYAATPSMLTPYDAVTGGSALHLTMKVPVGGSETLKINCGAGTETLKLDFTGVRCETADDANVRASLVSPSELDETFSDVRTAGLDSFVNRNVVGDYNVKAHRLSLTSNGYVPYKTGFKRFSSKSAQQEGNYVAFSFDVGDTMTSKDNPFKVKLLNNKDSEGSQAQFPIGDASTVTADGASKEVSVLKLLDKETVAEQIGRYDVIYNGIGDGSEIVLVDYSELKLVSKKEANDATVAAEYITKNIPAKIENTAACKNAIESTRAAYDALTAGGQAQVQMMHTDAYNKLINAESEYAKVSQGSTTTPKPATSTTTSDVVKKGTTVNVNGATYKVTGSKTVTYKKAPKNKKNVKVPATIKIKNKSYKVTAIANNAFKGNKKVKTVTVGKNVKTIGSSAFQNCKALTKVTLPAKTTTIKKNAFANSKKLKTVIVKSKKMTKSTVKASAFKKVSKKATFNVPNNKVKAYTKLFRQKGLPKACKIK